MILTTTLPVGKSVNDLVAACRDALARFAVLAPDMAALTRWLEGPYRAALVLRMGRLDVSLTDATAPSAIKEAQQTLLDLERKAGSATFVADLPPRLHVARIEDDRGHVAFAPLGRETLLRGRVIALFVADYLTRPDFYLAK